MDSFGGHELAYEELLLEPTRRFEENYTFSPQIIHRIQKVQALG